MLWPDTFGIKNYYNNKIKELKEQWLYNLYLQFFIPTNDNSTVIPQLMPNDLTHMKFHMFRPWCAWHCRHGKVSILLLKFDDFLRWTFTFLVIQKTQP